MKQKGAFRLLLNLQIPASYMNTISKINILLLTIVSWTCAKAEISQAQWNYIEERTRERAICERWEGHHKTEEVGTQWLPAEAWTKPFVSDTTWEIYSSTDREKIYRKHFDEKILGAWAYYTYFHVDPQNQQIQKIEITYLEVGTALDNNAGFGINTTRRAATLAKFDKDFRSTDRDLRNFLQSQFGQGKTVYTGKASELRQANKEYSAPYAFIRITTNAGQLIQATISPNLTTIPQPTAIPTPTPSEEPQPTPTAWADPWTTKQAPTQGQLRKAEFQTNVKTYPNGDVVIENIPMVDQGSRGICTLAILTMVTNYFHLDTNLNQIIGRGGYNLQTNLTTGADALNLAHALAKEGKLKLTDATKMQELSIQNYINKGIPIIIEHHISPTRMWQLLDYAQKRKQNPNFTLPSIAQDQKNWPSRNGEPTGNHISLITGYNKARGEYFVTDSLGEARGRIRYIRTEEIEATSYRYLVFTP